MTKTQWAVTVDGAYIAYQDVGPGTQALVLIHGWWSHLELSWEDPSYARFMDRLARRLRVLVFDKRGTGMSDRFTEPPHLEARMDDVRAVMDAAGVERAALLGWGTGGPQLGCMFAATYPERTVALCIDPNVHEAWEGAATEEELEREIEQLTAMWGRDDVPLSGYDDAPTDPEYVRAEARAARFSATPGGIAALTRMWFHTDVRDVLPTIRVPTLVFHKERGWSNPESAARGGTDTRCPYRGRRWQRDGDLRRGSRATRLRRSRRSSGRSGMKSRTSIGCSRRCCSPTSWTRPL